MNKTEIDSFLKTYKESVVGTLEKGFTKDFEDGPNKEEMTKLWEAIHRTLLSILTCSINLIYPSDMDLVASLHSQLSGATADSKASENASVGLTYLSSPEVARQLIVFKEESHLETLMQVFGQVALLRSKHF